MGRIREAYESKFRALLGQVGARRENEGVAWLTKQAERLSGPLHTSPERSLEHVYQRLSDQVEAFSSRRPLAQVSPQREARQRFLCDAGLGGLARWLRAAGYEAIWKPHIDDDVLLQEARHFSATILTTDSILMERRLLRDRIIPALWLPPTLTIPGQLALVFRDFGLTVGEPRCMSCGGDLRRADKEALRERIPPKTYRWLDEYFVCSRCDKLFWRGTHWCR